MNAQLADRLDTDKVLGAIATIFTEWHRLDRSLVYAVPEDREQLIGKQRGIELCISVLMNRPPGEVKKELVLGLGDPRRGRA